MVNKVFANLYTTNKEKTECIGTYIFPCAPRRKETVEINDSLYEVTQITYPFKDGFQQGVECLAMNVYLRLIITPRQNDKQD